MAILKSAKTNPNAERCFKLDSLALAAMPEAMINPDCFIAR